MKPTQRLRDAGQSLWLDNITRGLLTSGTLKRYIDDLSVTGLTSNPTIFNQALEGSAAYDDAIRDGVQADHTGETRFFDLAIDDLARAGASTSIRSSGPTPAGLSSPELSPTRAQRRCSENRGAYP